MTHGSPVTRRRWRVRHLAHLVLRFATSLAAGPPSVDDEVWAEDRLLAGERQLWRRLGNADRRHSIAVARRFAAVPRPRAEVAGALLHDIGKIESDLGTLERVLATLAGPVTARYRSYRDHESIGADLLERAGSDPVTVAIVAGRHPLSAEVAASDDRVIVSR